MADVTEIKNTETVVETSKVEPEKEKVSEAEETKTPSIEELMAQIAAEKAEKEKLKNQVSKANSEAAEYKKALRSKQTAQEQEDEAKREQQEQHEAYVKDLESFKNKTLAKERYLLQGMPVEMAEKAAQAEIEGDMDTLATIQKQHTDATVKAARAEWQKSIPETNRGTGDGATMTKEEIFKIKDPIERQKAIAQNLQLFE